jgi:anti-sigma factor RsiW
MRCEEATISLGVYLVGAIDPTERAEVEAHLADCPRCRAELADLAMLPTVLDKLSIDDIGAAEPAPVASEDLFARVAAQARVEAAEVTPLRRRPRWHKLAAAAAAVVLVGGVSVTAVEVLRTSDRTQTVSAVQGPVRMRVVLSSQTSGTALRVTVSGLERDEHCRLIAYADDGNADLVGEWDATYGGEGQMIGSTPIAPDNLRRLVLLGHDGNQLVAVAV